MNKKRPLIEKAGKTSSMFKVVLYTLIGIFFSFNGFAQAPCDSSFTGLTSPMCTSNPSILLNPTTPGGTFTGPGIVGNTFNAAIAGPGTHTIGYSVSVAPGATYTYSQIPFVAPPVVTNLVTLSDDQVSASLPIGFTFNYYGANYTQFEISSNGFITFDLGQISAGCCQGQLMPDPLAPNNVIAAVWDDLYPPGLGTVGYETFGVAPNRTLVVSWTNTPFCCGSTPDVTTSITLYETTNIIEIHTTSVNNASPATMGIENLGGTLATTVPTFNAGTINGSNIGARFSPSSPCTLNSSTQTVVVDPSPTITTTALPASICPGNSSTISATGGVTYTWNPGNLSGATQTVSPAVTTTYTVTATGVNGCTNSSTITINVTGQLPIVVTASPAVVCLGGSSTLTASGATTYTWLPGNINNTSITVSPLVTTSYTVTGSNGLGCTGSAIFTLGVSNVSVTITPNAVPCADTLTAFASGGAIAGVTPGARYYIRDVEPWSTANNVTAMDSVFGVGNYNNATFTSANPATIFVPSTQFVFLEGSDQNALALNTFVTTNITAIESWVNAGGRLFMNAAPNLGTNMNWGFGGVVLDYSNAQSAVNAVVPAHPIFNGPFVPVVTAYTGGSYSHAHITGGATTALLAGGGFNVLTEKVWGSGLVVFGGITSPNFHTPLVEAQNLWQNIIQYCSGAAVAPTYTYLWSNSAVTQTTVPTTVGIYTVTATNNGCSATATYNLIGFNPTVTATANPSGLCAGASTTLSATGATSYVWQPGNLSGANQTITPLTTTTYTVTGSTPAGCSATSTVLVTVTNLSGLNVVQSGTNCADTLTAVVTGGVPGPPANGTRYYIRDTDPWATTNNTTAMTAVFGANYVTTTYAAANPATVFVPGTQFVFLEGSDVNALALDAYINANIAAIESWVNAGGRLFLNAAPNGGANMNWGFGGVVLNYSNPQSNVVATMPAHPIYSGPFTPVTTAYSGGSYSHAYITGGATTSILAGTGFDVLTQKAWGTGLVMFGGITSPNFHTPAIEAQNLWQNIISYCATSSLAPAYTYLWSTNAVTQSIVPPSSGTYTVTVTNSGCSATTSITITINTPPVMTVTANPGTICPGQSTTLTASGANTYNWMPGNLSGPTIVVNPAVTTTYTVTGTSIAGCTASAQVTVTVSGQIPITATATPGTICPGGSSTLLASGANTYTWMPGNLNGTSVNVSPASTTAYTVTGTSAAGCTGTTIVTVVASPNPTVTANASPSNAICQGDQVMLTGGGASTYTWTGGVVNGVLFSPAATATYTVTGTNAAGCTNNASITVTVSPSTAPGVATLTSNPSIVYTGQSTVFTVNIPAGITAYTIHWYRNNVLTNTTNNPINTYTYTPNSLADSVYAWLIPSGCFNPDSVKTNTIKPRTPIGINDITVPAGFELYPNPSSNMIYVTGTKAGDEMILTDVVGKTILRKSIANSDKLSFSMEALADGVYYAKFTRDGKNWVIKVIKE